MNPFIMMNPESIPKTSATEKADDEGFAYTNDTNKELTVFPISRQQKIG